MGTILKFMHHCLTIKMSQDQGYWSSAFKLWDTHYENNQWRKGLYDKKHFLGEVDNHDNPSENSALSNHANSRRYLDPFEGIPYPRECAKVVGRYFECRVNHGVISPADSAPAQCNDKKAAVFEDCPHWVLENLAYKRKFFKRAEIIDRLTYERAMEVSDYNR